MPVPVISVEQMRQWEAAAWAEGCQQEDVIRRAGGAVGKRARQLCAPGDRVLILAGKGNNGADAREAAVELQDCRLQIVSVIDPVASLAEVEAALASKPAVVIDGLFGIGLNRPLDADWVALIETVNRAGLRVVSVDVPSGLNADTGEPAGAVIRASITVTLGAPKQGLIKTSAAAHVGRLELAPDVGLTPCPFESDLQWTLAEDFHGFPPERLAGSHKGNYGHLLLVAGSLGYHGAAVLAARAAHLAMPGLVTLLTMQEVYTPVAAQLQSTMVNVWDEETQIPDEADAVAFGPGLVGDQPADLLRRELSRAWQVRPFPMLADASGLDYVIPEPKRHEYWRVITPHPGEAARMLNVRTEAVQRDRVGALRELSWRFGDCLVILKGQHTLIGSSSGPVFINPTGNPGLAQGGAGDVLTGLLAGLLVQHEFLGDLRLTMRYGVHLHGAAADALAFQRPRWAIEELISEIGSVRVPL